MERCGVAVGARLCAARLVYRVPNPRSAQCAASGYRVVKPDRLCSERWSRGDLRRAGSHSECCGVCCRVHTSDRDVRVDGESPVGGDRECRAARSRWDGHVCWYCRDVGVGTAKGDDRTTWWSIDVEGCGARTVPAANDARRVE